MYGTKEIYGTDHSASFSTQVTTQCTVHIIAYMYKWISYPVNSKYNSGVFRKRWGVKCDITGTVKVIVAVQHYNVSIMYIINDTQPADANE
jgi:hypothetical protein